MKYYIQVKNNKIVNCVTCAIAPEIKNLFIEVQSETPINIGDTYLNGKIVAQQQEFVFDTEKIKYRQELNGIQKWLADNDWKINKIVIGEWTTEDHRWQSYLEERTIKRKRYDELLAKVGE